MYNRAMRKEKFVLTSRKIRNEKDPNGDGRMHHVLIYQGMSRFLNRCGVVSNHDRVRRAGASAQALRIPEQRQRVVLVPQLPGVGEISPARPGVASRAPDLRSEVNNFE